MKKNTIHRGVQHARGVKRRGRTREVEDRKLRCPLGGTVRMRGTSHDDHEEAITHTVSKECRKMRTWLWLVGLKKGSKPSKDMTTCQTKKWVAKCQRRHPCVIEPHQIIYIWRRQVLQRLAGYDTAGFPWENDLSRVAVGELCTRQVSV